MQFSGPKWPVCPEQKIFRTNHYYYFHLLIGSFHCAKFKKFFRTDPGLWGCTIFGPKIVHLPQTKFFRKTINIILIYLLAPFILKKIKPIQIYEDVPFSGPKYPKFLVQTIIITFIYLLTLLIGQNFKNILTADPELWECTIFGPNMVHLTQTNFFLENY